LILEPVEIDADFKSASVSFTRLRLSTACYTIESIADPDRRTGSSGPGERNAMEIIRVSADSKTSAVAGAIAGVMREHKRAEVQAIGAGAVNQAVKACAIARAYLQDDGLDVICIPSFVDVEIEGKERTALRLAVELR